MGYNAHTSIALSVVTLTMSFNVKSCDSGVLKAYRPHLNLNTVSMKSFVKDSEVWIDNLHFKVENFANLSCAQGTPSYSNVATDSNGDRWKIKVYPGGFRDEDGMVAFLPTPVEAKPYPRKVRFDLTVLNSLGGVYVRCQSDVQEYSSNKRQSHGVSQVAKRSDLVDKSKKILVKGSLLINLCLQRKVQANSVTVPPSEIAEEHVRLLESGKGSDTTLMVQEGGKQNFIQVHRTFFLSFPNTPLHNAIFMDEDKSNVIEIKGADMMGLSIALYFVYARSVPHRGDWKKIIKAADLLELVDLKLAVESLVVGSLIIDKDNASDWLMFAQANVSGLYFH